MLDYIMISIALILMFASFFFGILFQRRNIEKENMKLNKTVEDIVERSKREAAEIIKESELKYQELVFKGKKELDREENFLKKEIQLMEKRILSKEENLDRKKEQLDRKEEDADRKHVDLNKKIEGINELKDKNEHIRAKLIEEVERVSGLTREEAKNILIEEMISDAKLIAAKTVKEIDEETKKIADKKAKSIIATAIQRTASDYVNEIAVTVVTLPSDEMKGRIIGREGRNIRTFENITGVDIIVDDTPEAVILSSFDPYRREIAKLTLEKLVVDGRIHPTRIEELYEKSKAEIEKHILEVGEETVFELRLNGVHQNIKKLIGRLQYRSSYGQNVLKHSIEVAKIAGIMAAELGIDDKMARRAGLMHDLGKAIDQESEGTHTEIGIEVAKKYNESPVVINAIASHHGEEEFKFTESVLVQSADAISASRPGARRELLESYIKRLENLENIAQSFEGVNKSFAIQAGREIRIIVEPEKISDELAIILSKDISKRIEEELTYPGQIKVTVIRESRAVEYAK